MQPKGIQWLQSAVKIQSKFSQNAGKVTFMVGRDFWPMMGPTLQVKFDLGLPQCLAFGLCLMSFKRLIFNLDSL